MLKAQVSSWPAFINSSNSYLCRHDITGISAVKCVVMVNNKNRGLQDPRDPGSKTEDDKQRNKNRSTSMEDERDTTRKNDKSAHGRKDRERK